MHFILPTVPCKTCSSFPILLLICLSLLASEELCVRNATFCVIIFYWVQDKNDIADQPTKGQINIYLQYSSFVTMVK